MRIPGLHQLSHWLPEKGSFAWFVMVMGLFALFFLVLPFAFWYSVWYGESLSPQEVEQALSAPVNPAAAGAMLMRMAEKMSRRDASMDRWHPRIIALSREEPATLRQNCAWAMGKAPGAEDFRVRLKEMLQDSDGDVRRAAAVSLASFGDPAGRPELLLAIRRRVVVSTASGSVSLRILPKDTTSPDTAIARVGDQFVTAGLHGTVTQLRVKDGEAVLAGQPLAEIEPSALETRDMLRALSRVGAPGDLDSIRTVSTEFSDPSVRDEAQAAIREIERRSEQTSRARID